MIGPQRRKLIGGAVHLSLGKASAEFLTGSNVGGAADNAAAGAVLSDGIAPGEDVFGREEPQT